MNDQIIMFIVGGITILVGALGFFNKTRRGQRMVRLMGDLGARIFYIVLGIAIVVFGFFL